MGNDERRFVDSLDDVGDREGFPGTSDADERLVLRAANTPSVSLAIA